MPLSAQEKNRIAHLVSLDTVISRYAPPDVKDDSITPPPGERGQWYCPFHAVAGHPPSLFSDSVRGVWRCTSCGHGGDVFDFVMEAEGVGFSSAAALLDEWYRPEEG